jgi:hypothetical protein
MRMIEFTPKHSSSIPCFSLFACETIPREKRNAKNLQKSENGERTKRGALSRRPQAMKVQRRFKNMNIFGNAAGFAGPRLGKQIFVSLLSATLLFATWPQNLSAHQDRKSVV